MISVSEAQEIVKSQGFAFPTEEVLLGHACGRVLAEEVKADRDYPPFNRSAMDGFALRAAEFKPSATFRLADTLFAGALKEKDYAPGEVVKIMTGAPVPAAFDAVVKVEDAEVQGTAVKMKVAAVMPGQHIAQQGEDLYKGAIALEVGVRILPPEIALLASLGKSKVKVCKSPKVVVVATGDEIKPVDAPVLPHQIRNSNGPVLAAFFRQQGIEEVEEYLVADEPGELKTILETAMQADIVVLSGGVSMGEADFVPATLEALGVRNLFHKVKLKPGKPIWFGRKEEGPVVFALPGNPLSSQVTFKLFIEPFLRACTGLEVLSPIFLKADFERQKHSPFEEYFPCKIVEKNGESVLQLCPFNGSGDVTAAALSHGLGRQPEDMASIHQGDLIGFRFWQSPR